MDMGQEATEQGVVEGDSAIEDEAIKCKEIYGWRLRGIPQWTPTEISNG